MWWGGIRVGLVMIVACGAPQAPVADAGPDARLHDAGKDSTADCSPVYVSPAGQDNQSGCSPAAAKRTIGAAIITAAASSSASPQVMVCHGIYDENVLLNATSVSLQGGFDCSQFARAADYGYPAFDPVNEAVVAPSGSGSALEVTGSIAPSVVVDGFSFHGSPVDNSPAVSIHDGPSIVLSNNRVVGGSGSGYSTGSTGLDIRNASPEITHDAIDGGSGTTSTSHIYGSIGVYLEGLAHIHDNQITGGTGTLGGDETTVQQTASIGLIASGGAFTGALAIQGNVIDAGHGTSLGTPTNFDVEGVSILTGSVDLVSNTISGGDWACSGFCAKTAVSTLQCDTVGLEGNRIYGGGGGSASAGVWAVLINNSKSVQIVNNMIHSGNREGTLAAAASDISLAYVSNAFIAHNTVFLAPSLAGSALHSFPTSLVQQFTVENNLFLSSGQGTALDLWRCNGLAALRNNAFSPMTTLFDAHGSTSCPGDNSLATVAATESLIVSDSGNAQGNIAIAATCSSSACATVSGCGSGGDQCAEALLDGFGASDLGFSGLTSGRWALAASPPCKISQGGMDLTSQVPQDAFGAPRTPPVSMGASEMDGACTP